MLARAAKEELAILLPNTMPEYSAADAGSRSGQAGRTSGLLVRLSALLRWGADLPKSAFGGEHMAQSAGS